MEDNTLQLELLSLQNSLAFSNENLVKSARENYIKELEIKLAKLEENVATFDDKIKDKDEVIAALKMSIAFCKNTSYNGNNNNNESTSRLNDLQASLRNRDKQLATAQSLIGEKDMQLKESEAKVVCLANQIEQMKVHLREYEAMLKSTLNSNHLLLESKQLIAARDRHIDELRNGIKGKEAQIALLELKLEERAKDDSKPTEFEEKLKLKDQTKSINILQTEIEQKNDKLKEFEQLLALCKAQLKEKNDQQTEKLLKEANIKINSQTNTITQLKQNIANLRQSAGATTSKAENGAHQKTGTMKKLLPKSERMLLDTDMAARKDINGIISTKCDAGWNLFYRLTAVSEMFNSLVNLNIITSAYPHELYIHLTDFDGVSYYAHYDLFVVGSKTEDFKLEKLGKYTGNAGDGMRTCLDNDFRMVEFPSSGPVRKRVRICWGLVCDFESEDCNMYTGTSPDGANLLLWMGKQYKIGIMFFRSKVNNNKTYVLK